MQYFITGLMLLVSISAHAEGKSDFDNYPAQLKKWSKVDCKLIDVKSRVVLSEKKAIVTDFTGKSEEIFGETEQMFVTFKINAEYQSNLVAQVSLKYKNSDALISGSGTSILSNYIDTGFYSEGDRKTLGAVCIPSL